MNLKSVIGQKVKRKNGAIKIGTIIDVTNDAIIVSYGDEKAELTLNAIDDAMVRFMDEKLDAQIQNENAIKLAKKEREEEDALTMRLMEKAEEKAESAYFVTHFNDEGVINKFRKKYRFLSNLDPVEITYNGLTYHSVEAAYHAQKCQNENRKQKYTNCTVARFSKYMGNNELYDRWLWESKSFEIMLDLIRIKFSNPELKEKLLATGDALIIEGNDWHDNNWGLCTCSNCKDKIHKNLLGKILMQVRDELRTASVLSSTPSLAQPI